MNTDPDKRLTAQFLWKEIFAFISGEKGAMYTTAMLCRQPGTTIRGYLDGDRQRLTNPMRYLLLACALVTTAFLFGLPKDTYKETVKPLGTSSSLDSLPPELTLKLVETRKLLTNIRDESKEGILSKNSENALEALDRTLILEATEIGMTWMNVFLLLALPVNAVISWICFRSAKRNLTEHVVANAYILGLQNLAAIWVVFFSLLNWIDFYTSTLIYMPLSFIYQFLAWKQTFAVRGILPSIICIFGLMMSITGYLILQGIGTALVLLYTFAR